VFIDKALATTNKSIVGPSFKVFYRLKRKKSPKWNLIGAVVAYQ